MSSHFLEINGCRFHVNSRGPLSSENPVLVLLHGFTGSAASWDPQIEGFHRAGCTTVAFDILGHGLSEAPADPTRYSFERSREDLLEGLLQLGILRDRAILLGYSMGGRLALFCALAGGFRGLILESASPGLADPQDRAARRASDEALAKRIEREGIPAFVDYWEQIPLFASQQHLPRDRWQAQQTQRLQNHPIGLANSLRGAGTGAQPPLHTHLSELELPILIMAGELDVKFREIARQMVEQLPQAELEIVPGAGHTIHLEKPVEFEHRILQYISILVG